MIEIDGLTKRYGNTTVVDGVSLEDRKSTRLNSSHT